ncbi:Fic family protein [Myxococcota bacterium]|nr:Fic family protein [Myxococcota bacterium]
MKMLDLDLSPKRFETPQILRKVATAGRKLAELKGLASSIPDQKILIHTLGIQEARDSSAIENIVTTQDELFRGELMLRDEDHPAAKEVLRYREALGTGFELVRKTGLLTVNHILKIQAVLENNDAGLRRLPGTVLKDPFGQTIFTPPQDPEEIVRLMGNLERFINDPDGFDADPLVKMALIHYQFECIHPFYDGNGRTGRIVNVLYLVLQGLLDIPVLYLSRHIIRTKSDYYRLLQDLQTRDAWEEWVLYNLDAVERTAAETLRTVSEISSAIADYRQRIREGCRFYRAELVDNLFMNPYTKIDFVARDLQVSRLTATKYLDILCSGGFLEKRRAGRGNYYVNIALNRILAGSP